MLKHIFKLEDRIMLNAVSIGMDIAVISEGIADHSDLVDAVQDDIVKMEYNPETDNLETLLQKIEDAAGDSAIGNISFATHGDNGEILLTAEETVTAESININSENKDQDQIDFFNGLAEKMAENGRIDFLACNLSQDIETSIESFTGKNVAISYDITGNSGNWILESDNIDLTAANGYFDAGKLEAF
ncbi:MAG: DUF4347 domain-containing protein, partial [Deltaproteobacteria bacterium]|nr:DUF4347 domain-containing protein [Deltaproteobacteria bacterium]